MTDLRDLLSIEEAAELAGRAPATLRAAAAEGRLDARLIGRVPRGVWVTTRAAISAYIARVATYAAGHQPQSQRRPGGHPRRRGRDRPS